MFLNRVALLFHHSLLLNLSSSLPHFLMPVVSQYVCLRPRTHWQFYSTREPFANGSRRVARVHTASTASGSSGTLRPYQDVFAVDANGSRRLGSAV